MDAKRFEKFEVAQSKLNQLIVGQQDSLMKINKEHNNDIEHIKNEVIVKLREELNDSIKALSGFEKILKRYKADLSEYELSLNENKSLIEKQDFTIELQDKRILNLNIDLKKLTNMTNIISLVDPMAYKDIQKEGKTHIIGRLGGDSDDRSTLLYGKYVRTMWNWVSNEVGVNSTKMIKIEDVAKAKLKIQQWMPIEKYKNKLLLELANKSDLKKRGKELTPKESRDVILFDRLQEKYSGDLIKHI